MAVSEQIPDAHSQAFRPGKRGHRAPVAPALEGDRWARQGNALKAMGDMGGFRLLAPQKLSSRRKIVEQVAHLDLRSRWSTDLTHRLDLAAETTTSVPAFEAASRVVSRNRETLAMLGSASPRNPIERTHARSAPVRILLVA